MKNVIKYATDPRWRAACNQIEIVIVINKNGVSKRFTAPQKRRQVAQIVGLDLHFVPVYLVGIATTITQKRPLMLYSVEMIIPALFTYVRSGGVDMS